MSSEQYSPVQAYEEAGQILEELQLEREQELPELTVEMVEEISGCLLEASITIGERRDIHASYRSWIVQHLNLASKYLARYVKGER